MIYNIFPLENISFTTCIYLWGEGNAHKPCHAYSIQ